MDPPKRAAHGRMAGDQLDLCDRTRWNATCLEELLYYESDLKIEKTWYRVIKGLREAVDIPQDIPCPALLKHLNTIMSFIMLGKGIVLKPFQGRIKPTHSRVLTQIDFSRF
jgi:hypothetical protein